MSPSRLPIVPSFVPRSGPAMNRAMSSGGGA